MQDRQHPTFRPGHACLPDDICTAGRWFALVPACILLALTAKLMYFGSLLSRGLWVPLSAPFTEPVPQCYVAAATLGCLAIAFAAILGVGRVGLLVASAIYRIVSLAAMADLIHVSFFGCVIPIQRLAQWRRLDDVAKAMASEW